MEKVKILLTGGLGHIGSFFIESFDSKNNEVTVVDNMSTQRYCSLFNVKNKIKFLEKNFVDLSEDFLSKYDCVIHLAAITDAAASFNESQKKKLEETNVEDTKRLIKKCKSAKVKKIIFPSSTSVYGKSIEVVDESMDFAVNPQSPYAESKIAIENFLKDELQESETKYLILRFGTIFGTSKGMRFHTAINKFCYQASMGHPLTVWKQNFHQVRPYLGLNDAVNSIFHFLSKEDRFWNNTYNVVTLNVSLSKIVNLIEESFSFVTPDKKVNLQMIDTPLLNQHSYNVSNEKITSTGFVHNDDLKSCIVDTIKTLSNINNE